MLLDLSTDPLISNVLGKRLTTLIFTQDTRKDIAPGFAVRGSIGILSGYAGTVSRIETDRPSMLPSEKRRMAKARKQAGRMDVHEKTIDTHRGSIERTASTGKSAKLVNDPYAPRSSDDLSVPNPRYGPGSGQLLEPSSVCVDPWYQNLDAYDGCDSSGKAVFAEPGMLGENGEWLGRTGDGSDPVTIHRISPEDRIEELIFGDYWQNPWKEAKEQPGDLLFCYARTPKLRQFYKDHPKQMFKRGETPTEKMLEWEEISKASYPKTPMIDIVRA